MRFPSPTHVSLAAVFDPADPRNILFERDHSFIVFISSKMAGGALAAERKAGIDAVENFRPARAWAWERDAPAGSYYSEEECIRRAGTSDALVLIVEDELTPITEAEFDAARTGTATVIVLARRGVERSQRLTRFIKNVREWGAITKEFGDLDELKSEIDLALWEWFVRGGRTLALQTREQRKGGVEMSLLEQAELVDPEGQAITLREAIDDLREGDLQAGRSEEALWDIYAWAATATEEDHFPLARVLLAELRSFIPAGAIDEVARGWILNIEGQIASGEGRDDAARYFEQMRQTGVATDDKELVSTALQNLGIQAVIADDHELAREHFRESFRLKKGTGDVFGTAQIALNMCNVFMAEGALELAGELLDDLDSYVRGPGSQGLRSAIHGQRGMVLTKEGQLDKAKELFQESLRFARRANSGARQMPALQSLGANAMERGRQREALRWFRKAIEIAEALGDSNRAHALRAATGAALAELEDWQEAAKEFVAAAQIAADLGDVWAEAQDWANVAACWSRLDRPEEAQRLIDQALSNPQADRAPDWRAGQLRNLGGVLEQLGKPVEAIQRLEEASRLAENTELKDQALQRAAEIALEHPGLAYQALEFLDRSLDLQRTLGTPADAAWRAANIAAQLSNSSLVADAPRYFSLALRVFARNGDRRRAFYVRNDRAIALGRVGQVGAAIRDMRAALEIARELGDRRLEYQAELNLGELERRRGCLSDAEAHELRALELARQSSDEVDQAAALNLLGLIRVNEDRLELAEKVYKEALEIGRRQKVDEAQHAALGGLAGIAFRRGRYAEAVKRYEQAVRRHAEDQTVALAEDLAGLALSRAARGNVVEEEVQRLIDISGVVGWDNHAAGELAECAWRLDQAGGDTEEGVSIAAAAATCALRLVHLDGDSPESLRDRASAVLAHALLKGALWMRQHPNYGELKSQFIEDVEQSFGVERGELDFLGTLFDEADSELSRVEGDEPEVQAARSPRSRPR
jgi:tetratricopeptide (TPR) repeat protein